MSVALTDPNNQKYTPQRCDGLIRRTPAHRRDTVNDMKGACMEQPEGKIAMVFDARADPETDKHGS